MDGAAPLPAFAAIVVAAGKGLRAGGDTPKQYRAWRGKPLLRHSVDRLLEAGAAPLIVVVAPGASELAREALGENADRVRFVEGGATRQLSVRNGLMSLQEDAVERVLIHDAARPDLPGEVIARLLDALERHAGAIPVLPVVDSIAIAGLGAEAGAGAGAGEVMAGRADRDRLRRVQTPQAFRYEAILAAHRAAADKAEAEAGDDAQVAQAHGYEVALVEGDERLKKITFARDLMDNTTLPLIRIGSGFDVHRLVEGEELWLCGTRIAHTHGLSGHSDADVALHALTDAILGAIGDGDIGTHFPPSDPQWAGARSGRFLEHAVSLARAAGYRIGNIDLTIICEAPKIGPHRPAMRAEVARLTGLGEGAVSIKATTTEKLGYTGRGEGIAAQAVATLQLSEHTR